MDMIKKLDAVITGTGEVKGFVFTQVFENENGYVYKVEADNSIHFESFLKKVVPICLDFKNRVYSEDEKKEIFPKEKDFGVWAWTSLSLENAIKHIT